MTIPDQRARMRRLDALSLGQIREVVELRQGTDPLLYAERKQYILALRQTIGGLESARVALVTSLPKSAGVYMSG